MTVAELSRVEALLIETLEQSGSPLPPQRLLEALASREYQVSASAVRRALWHLVSLGRIDFTDDMRVQLVA